ncbi:MAG: hypothetical protein WD118_10445 [Phycisphaeraceae bacterium]
MLKQATQESTGREAVAWRGWRKVLTHTHTYSGRADHGGVVRPPESYRQLAAWAHQQGIDALGMGSPYTPGSARTQGRYDGDERDRYYNGEVDPRQVHQLDEVRQMLRDVQAVSANGTRFYLDNETPKGRFGHLWWVGYHPDMPAWHDYDQDFDRWMVHQSQAGDDGDEPMPYARRPYAQIVAIQRQHGALGFWAHPTSWWRGGQGQFITNIASEMPAHLVAEGFVDGMVVMGYHAYRPQYLALWHKLLDAGYRVPGVAEMDVGLSDPGTWSRQRAWLNHVYTGEGPDAGRDVADLTAGFGSGRLVCSSGPMIDLHVDGQPMGSAVQTDASGWHEATIRVAPDEGMDRVARVELVGRGGEVLWSASDVPAGVQTVRVPGLAERGYLLVRVFGDVTPDVADSFRKLRSFAVSNPVYLHPRGQSFEAATTTQVRVQLSSDSPYHGGRVQFESATGEVLEAGSLSAEGAAVRMPAIGRVTLATPQGETRTDYLINANERLMAVQRYLYRGRFLRDLPDCHPGEVPPEAWRLDAYRDAMREMDLVV